MGLKEILDGLNDQDLMNRLKTAPSEDLVAGFEVVLGRHKNAIVSYLYRFVGDFRTAEDLAQETFLRVFRRIRDYNDSAKFTTWLYTIASNLAKDEFKRRARHPAISMDWQGGGDTTREMPQVKADTTESVPVVRLERREVRQTVTRALDELDDHDREVLVLRDMQGMAYDEISTVLGLPLGTVKSRIARARLAFKDVWKRIGA